MFSVLKIKPLGYILNEKGKISCCVKLCSKEKRMFYMKKECFALVEHFLKLTQRVVLLPINVVYKANF